MMPLEGAALGYCSFPVDWLQTVGLATSDAASVSPYWLQRATAAVSEYLPPESWLTGLKR